MRFLVTAIGSMSAEAVITGLARRKGVRVFGCNTQPREWVAASRLLDGFCQVPPASDQAAYLSELILICRRVGITHVVALTDPEIDVLSANAKVFLDEGIMLCIPPCEAVRRSRDKMEIYNTFSGSLVTPIPTLGLDSPRAGELGYPLLAKPKNGRSSEGKTNIPDADALAFWRVRLPADQYIVQPFIKGDVFVTDIVADAHVSAWVTRQELVRTPNGAGLTVKVHPGHACGKLAKQVYRTLGLKGCVNIEFLVSAEGVFLMDVNPRFSAGVAFSVLSGYDMVDNHVRCFAGEQLDECGDISGALYTRGFVEYIIGQEDLT